MCGICGVYILGNNLPDVATALNSFGLDGHRLVQNGAAAAGIAYVLSRILNNRGHDSSGIVSYDGKQLHSHRGMGFVKDVHNQATLEALVGEIAEAHNRYATTGLPLPENIQPFQFSLDLKGSAIVHMSLAHQGNLINEKDLRRIIEAEEKRQFGSVRLTSTTDSELMLHALAIELYKNPKISDKDLIGSVFNRFLGAYSTVVMIGDKLIAVRDPRGYWPLHVARLGELVLFASEDIAIKKFIGAAKYELQKGDFITEVKNGQIVVVTPKIMGTYSNCFPPKPETPCAFDWTYLRNPDDKKVRQFRIGCGKPLAKNLPSGIDYVVPVPKSGFYYARGLSDASGIPYNELIGVSEKYRDEDYRTFQESTEQGRLEAARKKYVFKYSYEGLKIVLVDDSLIRNTTLRHVIKEMRKRKAEQIHVRLCMPPYVTPCYLGVHTPTKDELIANVLGTEERVEKYFESIFYGVDYDRDKLVRLVKEDMSIEQIVRQSVQEMSNFFMREPHMRQVQKGKFSLKYFTMEDYKQGFDTAGLDPNKRCYACMTKDGQGYPEEFRIPLKEMGRI